MNLKSLPTLSLVKTLGTTATPILLYHFNKSLQLLLEKQNQTLEVNKQLLSEVKEFNLYIQRRNEKQDNPKPLNFRNG